MDKRVLVTGATGFIGGYVVKTLLQRGLFVIATGCDESKLNDMPWAHMATCVALDMDSLPDDLFDVLQQPTHCIHLAWGGLSNYRAETHLTEELPKNEAFLSRLIDGGLKQLLVAGTCLEYGMIEGELDETIPPRPNNCYAEAKNRLRLTLQSYASETDCLLKWARIFYLYGEGQNPRSLFAQLDRALEEGAESFDMSGGEQVRDYLHVRQVADYIVRIALDDAFAGIVNVCSGREIQLRHLVQEYLDKRVSSTRLNLGIYPYPDWEPFRFWGSNKKLLERFGSPVEAD